MGMATLGKASGPATSKFTPFLPGALKSHPRESTAFYPLIYLKRKAHENFVYSLDFYLEDEQNVVIQN
jgi:hypothetical protein